MVFIWLGIAALGGWWLYYFNRGELRSRFEGQVTEAPLGSRRRPLSIVALAMLNLAAVPWMLLSLWKASSPAAVRRGVARRARQARLSRVADRGHLHWDRAIAFVAV